MAGAVRVVAATQRMRFKGRWPGYLQADGRAGRRPCSREEVTMLAAIGFGIIGTIIVVALIIAVVLWLLNRA
jgi:hypothetical protein